MVAGFDVEAMTTRAWTKATATGMGAVTAMARDGAGVGLGGDGVDRSGRVVLQWGNRGRMKFFEVLYI